MHGILTRTDSGWVVNYLQYDKSNRKTNSPQYKPKTIPLVKEDSIDIEKRHTEDFNQEGKMIDFTLDSNEDGDFARIKRRKKS